MNKDMEAAKKEFDACFELMKSRTNSYGSSWRTLTIQSIANLIEMKTHRISRLGELDAKVEDEFIDAACYAIFGLIKLHERDKRENE